LAEGFQRKRLKCEKLTDNEDGRRTTSDGKSSHCLWQGEIKIKMEKKYFYAFTSANDKFNP
jgi:hypothetical protein